MVGFFVVVFNGPFIEMHSSVHSRNDRLLLSKASCLQGRVEMQSTKDSERLRTQWQMPLKGIYITPPANQFFISLMSMTSRLD